jgi:hypothetical protein
LPLRKLTVLPILGRSVRLSACGREYASYFGPSWSGAGPASRSRWPDLRGSWAKSPCRSMSRIADANGRNKGGGPGHPVQPRHRNGPHTFAESQFGSHPGEQLPTPGERAGTGTWQPPQPRDRSGRC